MRRLIPTAKTTVLPANDDLTVNFELAKPAIRRTETTTDCGYGVTLVTDRIRHQKGETMGFGMWEASVPVFVSSLTNMRDWLDKAAQEKSESALMEARLAPDMRPLPAQYQMASDSAKNALARLTGTVAPSMPDTEMSFAELKNRCDQTIDYLNGFSPDDLNGSEDRGVAINFPNGMGYRFLGAQYLAGFALPNFFFHATTAYAILRSAGVSLGKGDFLQHLGPPSQG